MVVSQLHAPHVFKILKKIACSQCVTSVSISVEHESLQITTGVARGAVGACAPQISTTHINFIIDY